MPNRLATETSPYLLQHQHNPVDWFAWGDEALERARSEDRPILLSVGYSACHWCHVMERESFEDPAVAQLMNDNFVCIKVDREERPDIDAIYMEAVQAIAGRGGWPLTVFITPEGKPFYGGTYFPPQAHHQLPSFRQVLAAVADSWQNNRTELLSSADQLHAGLVKSAALVGEHTPLNEGLLEQALDKLAQSYDSRNGGFGSAPKFPPSTTLDFLLRWLAGWNRSSPTGNDGNAHNDAPVANVGTANRRQQVRGMVEHTLTAMASGGMYDQIGGGFARYAVDATWTVPHFEKMLYDNAQLASVYLHGWQVTGEKLFKQVCVETLDWVLRDLRVGDGGFASALDADSEGEEGKFYVWTLDELRALLGEERAEIARSTFGMSVHGNFEGSNIPVRARDRGLDATGDRKLDTIRRDLLAARAQRVWPSRDDKRITAWNALMITALAEAGIVLDRPDYTEAAVECAEFIERTLITPSGRVLRSFNHGKAAHAGNLDDHALLMQAFLTLYETTFDSRWFERAQSLADLLLDHFCDSEDGGFFATADDHEQLIVRRKDLQDGPTPAGSAAAASGLLRLNALTGDQRYETAALKALGAVAEWTARYPIAFSQSLTAIDFHLASIKQVALVGSDLDQLQRVVFSAFRPHVVVAGRPHAESIASVIPLLANRAPIDDKPTAYVCQDFACQLPVTDPQELTDQLEV